MLTEKIPPHDTIAEEATIGSLLIDDSAFDRLNLSPEDFYNEHLQVLYRVCIELVSRSTSINQITVATELQRQSKLEFCGGTAFLSHLISVVPTSLDVEHYAQIVKTTAMARRMVSVGERISQLGYSNPADIPEALNKADQFLVDLRKQGVASPIILPSERVNKLFERYAELHSKEMVMALRTGLNDLDRLLGGGFYNGDVIVVGGRTSMGKTTFINSLAHSIGAYGNVLFCSAEMNADAISDRDVAQRVGVPINRIRLGNYDTSLFDSIIEALGQIESSNVILYDETPMTTDKIMQASVAVQVRFGLKMVIIDYLGMLDDEYGRNQYERMGYMSRKLKHMARKLDVPVIVVHQLNRALEQREDKRPQLFDLRDSGVIEQDTDVVIFLYRDSYYAKTDEDANNMVTELIVAKQRQGDTGIVRTVYDKAHQRYLPYTDITY